MRIPPCRVARTVLGPGWSITGRMVGVVAGMGARRLLPEDSGQAVTGRMVELPDRGSTFVIDVPGPGSTAPTIVLLHALGCTAHLSWAAALEELSRTHRVIAFDQRWHGRGIGSPHFRFADCADDVAAVLDVLGIERAVVAGYSMGGAIAQLVWRRHPGRVSGLVLCSTARNYRGLHTERLFFPVLGALADSVAAHAHGRVERLAATLPAEPLLDRSDPLLWGRTEFRSSSLWAFPHVVAELGRFNSAAWVGEVDVPTAVLVTEADRTIPARRQHRLADAIPRASRHSAPGGHASIVLGARTWLPVFREAVDAVGATVVSTTRSDPSRASSATASATRPVAPERRQDLRPAVG